MKKVIRCLPLLLLGLVMTFTSSAQVPVDSVTNFLRAGDAQRLSQFFGQTLDIGLPDKDQDYSKTQGERVIKEFFEKNPPSGYTVEENGELGAGSHFIIGNYLSGKTEFQVYIIFKQSEGRWLITKLKIEKE